MLSEGKESKEGHAGFGLWAVPPQLCGFSKKTGMTALKQIIEKKRDAS